MLNSLLSMKVEAAFWCSSLSQSSAPFQIITWTHLTKPSATSVLLVGSTSMPWCSVAMMSTGPPFFVATVGTPWAAACGQEAEVTRYANALEHQWWCNWWRSSLYSPSG